MKHLDDMSHFVTGAYIY